MTAKVIAVFNQKGGCGKTMTTMQLAGSFGRRGYRVLVVDMDPQGTATMWNGEAGPDEPFPAKVVSLAPMREKMVGEIAKHAEDCDAILIDCPPAIESSIPWAALIIADVGLIPVIPVMDNIWASKKAKELALRAKQENPDLKTFYVASMIRRGKLFTLCQQELRDDQDVILLDTPLSMRNAFPESQVYGTTVHGLSLSSTATQEVEALADELLDHLNMKEVA